KTNYEDVDISMRLKNKGYLLSYVPEAICYHLKRDTFISVLAMARRWSFHSYPNPSSLFKLILRIFIYNVHYFIHAFMADIRLGRLENLSITLTIPLYFAYYDVDHFMRPR
ncbi:MAG: hypothetical protein NDI94_06960, partial [Candidatus Woesearchaeota archaeon]|nr:hypothetical protein [Candidatus Woesearchaeota archaeon]